MRIAVRYGRSGPAKYVSHLDMQRSIGRAVRRAHIHACYSQGFNPHLQMSFASPLSVGYETRSDYVELEVGEDQLPEDALAALRDAAPPGIEFRNVYRIPEKFGKLMARCDSASYEVRFTLATETETDYYLLQNALEKLKASNTYSAVDKKGREKDIKPLIRDLTWNGRTAFMHIANASSGSLNPAVVADALLRDAGLDGTYEVCRMECFALGPEGPASFADLFEAGPQSADPDHRGNV